MDQLHQVIGTMKGVNMSATTLAAFFLADEKIRVHSGACTYTIRESKIAGAPAMIKAESLQGMIMALKRRGIRSNDIRFMPCCGVPEGFDILSPNGEVLKLSTTRQGARTATNRIKREAVAELTEALENLSAFARQMLDNQAQS